MAATPRSQACAGNTPTYQTIVANEHRGQVFETDGFGQLGELLDSGDYATLLQKLRGSSRKAAVSPQGHLVLCELITTWSSDRTAFILEDLLGSAVEIARNTFGCVVLCELVEKYTISFDSHSSDLQDNLVTLLDELTKHAASLCRNATGHRVVDVLLDHGSADRRASVAESLQGHLIRLARHATGSRFVQRTLQSCGPEALDAAAAEILASEPDILQLAQHRFGRHVVKTFVQVPGHHGTRVLNLIEDASERLRRTKYGARFLVELGREGLRRNPDKKKPDQRQEPHVQRLRWSDEISDDERIGVTDYDQKFV